MKAMELTETKKRKVYVAEDGREFTNEYECIWYETDIVIKNKFKSARKIDGYDEDRFAVYHINSPEEHELLKAYYLKDRYANWNVKVNYSRGFYPMYVFVSEHDCGDYSYHTSFTIKEINEQIATSREHIDKFEEDINDAIT